MKYLAALALLLLPATADAEQIGRWFSPRGGATAAIVREFDAAKDSIWVLAYTFTSRPIADALIMAKNRGVEIVVILDSDSVNGRGSQATRLIDAGCLVLSDAAHPIAHNKVSIIDGVLVFGGSFNYSAQAEMNAENLTLEDGREAVHDFIDDFRRHRQHSIPLKVRR